MDRDDGPSAEEYPNPPEQRRCTRANMRARRHFCAPMSPMTNGRCWTIVFRKWLADGQIARLHFFEFLYQKKVTEGVGPAVFYVYDLPYGKFLIIHVRYEVVWCV